MFVKNTKPALLLQDSEVNHQIVDLQIRPNKFVFSVRSEGVESVFKIYMCESEHFETIEAVLNPVIQLRHPALVPIDAFTNKDGFFVLK